MKLRMWLRHSIFVFLASTIISLQVVAVVDPVIYAKPVTENSLPGGECTAPAPAPTWVSSSCMNGVSWLGGEPNLLSMVEETLGVQEVLRLLTEEEQNQIVQSDATLPIRFFRGAKGNATKAAFYLKKTVEWRRRVRVNDIINCMNDKRGSDAEIRNQIVQEHETGCMYVRGYDVDGRAMICAHLGARNTRNEEAQLRSLIYTLEKAFACTARKSMEIGGRPLEKVLMIFDFDGYSLKNSFQFSTLKKVNEILSFQYPERLTAVYMINPPVVFSLIWKMIRPFIDPVTRQKYHICSSERDLKELTARVRDPDKLELAYGGTSSFVRPFDAREYLQLPFEVAFDEGLEF